MNALVLLSGGLDSATTAHWMAREGYELTAITFDYGQRHRIELDRAKVIARRVGVNDHILFPVPLHLFGGSALVDERIIVPENRVIDDHIPPTYVPARNLVFLSIATALAEARCLEKIFIGANAIDYSGYPDCRPLFIERMNGVIEAATRAGVEGHPITVEAPLLRMTKAQIIRKGLEVGVDFSLTLSCYNPDPAGKPCGVCDACILRAKGFAEAGIKDSALGRSR